jgi:YggT family protein
VTSPWARWVRRWSDPLLKPFERRVISRGGNPQDAPLWLAGAVLLAGLALILVVRWLLDTAAGLGAMRGAGSGTWLRFAISAAFSLLMTAVLIRVVGSWVGVGRYNRWMRPFYSATDWLIEPIRRRLPPFGAIDVSPVLAYLLLLLLREAILRALG